MPRVVNQLVIHHTASASGTVESIRKEHMSRKPPFSDIGYHYVIGCGKGLPDGHIAEGRPEDLQGSGVMLNNRGKLQVCLIGDFEKGDKFYTGLPTVAQYAALGHWLLVKGKQYANARTGAFPTVVGHKEVALPQHPTACPGNQFPLNLIRLWYNRAIQDQKVGKIPVGLDVFIAQNKKG
jgi:N-acetylmuramoyl-L-alanine amidase